MAALEIAVLGVLASALLLTGLRAGFLPVAVLVILAAAVSAGLIVHWPIWRTTTMLAVSVIALELGYLAGTWIRSTEFDVNERVRRQREKRAEDGSVGGTSRSRGDICGPNP